MTRNHDAVPAAQHSFFSSVLAFLDPILHIAPADPLRDPETGAVYPVPATQAEWQRAADVFVAARGLSYRVQVAFDGLMIDVG